MNCFYTSPFHQILYTMDLINTISVKYWLSVDRTDTWWCIRQQENLISLANDSRSMWRKRGWDNVMTDCKLNSIFVGLNVCTFREKYTSSLRACSCMCSLSFLRENTNGGSRISQRGVPNPEIRQLSFWKPVMRNELYTCSCFSISIYLVAVFLCEIDSR